MPYIHGVKHNKWEDFGRQGQDNRSGAVVVVCVGTACALITNIFVRIDQTIQLVIGKIRCTGKADALKLCVLSLMYFAVEVLNQKRGAVVFISGGHSADPFKLGPCMQVGVQWRMGTSQAGS